MLSVEDDPPIVMASGHDLTDVDVPVAEKASHHRNSTLPDRKRRAFTWASGHYFRPGEVRSMIAVYVVCSLLVIPVGLAMVYRSLFLRNRQCLQCNSQIGLERIPRSPVERVIGRCIPNRKYRCGHCGWIGLIREKVARQASESSPGTNVDISTLADQTPIPAPQIEPKHSLG